VRNSTIKAKENPSMPNKEGKTFILEHKPDVVHIGFQRAGSTYLRSYFTFHPDIRWTRTAGYFESNEKFFSQEYMYCDLNAKNEKNTCTIDMWETHGLGHVIGEKFNSLEDRIFYMKGETKAQFNRDYYYPDPGETAKRIKSVLPEGKILIVLRNQESWLRSNYLHQILDLPGREKTFYDYISTRAGKAEVFGGLYHHVIDAYYQLFGKENVLVILLEQIKLEKEETLKKLCRFLGVDFVPFPEAKGKMNKGIGKRVGSGIRICSHWGIGITRKNSQRFSLLTRLFGKLKILDRDVLKYKEKSFIHSFYGASNCHTSMLTGIDLASYGYPI
jgi:hypothetical protein